MPEAMAPYVHSPLLWFGIFAWLAGFSCAWGWAGLRAIRRNHYLRAILSRRL